MKALHIMGGAFPSSAEIIRNPWTDGAEWNFWALDTPDVTAAALDRISALGVAMTFVGYEVGKPVVVGHEVAPLHHAALGCPGRTDRTDQRSHHRPLPN